MARSTAARPRTFVALLRAVNVGGTGLISMQDLAAVCTAAGFEDVRTYIQSGNVVFRSTRGREAARASLERALAAHMGRTVDVFVREASELQRILAANPFPRVEPARVAVLFCSQRVPSSLAKGVVAPDGEQVVAGKDEIYVHYPNGMGRSKLKLPAIEGAVTARNLNTVAKLAAMAAEAARLPPAPASRPAPRAGARKPRRTARSGRRPARA